MSEKILIESRRPEILTDVLLRAAERFGDPAIQPVDGQLRTIRDGPQVQQIGDAISQRYSCRWGVEALQEVVTVVNAAQGKIPSRALASGTSVTSLSPRAWRKPS